MKTQIRTALTTLGLTALMSGVYGQTRSSEVAQIPFAFQVGNKVLPAGTYSATLANSQGLIQLEERATGKSVMVAAFVPQAGPSNQSKLAFRCYGGRCFLSEIWYASQPNGYGLAKSTREKEIAVNEQAPKVVYLASR